MSLTYIQFFLVLSSFPSPPPPAKKKGETEARERLRKPDTNRVPWRHSFAKKKYNDFLSVIPFADSFVNSYWRELVICFHTNEQDGEQNVFMVIF